MFGPSERNNSKGFLSRLLRDEAGNTIAIMAAAVIPVLGLVGGAVDISRIYLVETRLQAACDAGALMGRKVMGTGLWADNGGISNTRAIQMFDNNFKAGDFGSGTRTRSFSEAGAAVSGTATVVVPMTLMKALGQGSRTLTVNCTSDQRVPDTDVMFVLDVTGSMAWQISSTSSQTRIEGLRIATKCFYETLMKENISSVSASQCGVTSDPTSGPGTSEIRFGFVPYSVNANVGRLLPLNYVADEWQYQTRVANYVNAVTGQNANLGNESGYTLVSEGPKSGGGDYPTTWTTSDSDITINNTKYKKKESVKNATECTNLNNLLPGPQTSTTYGDYVFVSQTPATPVHPETAVTKTYSRTATSTTTAYQYVLDGKKCNLQYRSKSDGTGSNTYTTTTGITWTGGTVSGQFDGWTYKQAPLNVSGLKNTASNSWKTSVDLPLGANGANVAIAWPGCVEERQTARVLDSNPLDDWDTVPLTALDMQIDGVPIAGNADTQWKPMLPNAVWERYSDGSRNTKTMSELTTDDDGDLDSGSVENANNSCPVAARQYQFWTPTTYSNYVDSLSTGGNTYHDAGLLWGARLMSTTGIFSATTASGSGEVVDRHMVFMTDGDTNTTQTNYASNGISWWDRREHIEGTAASKDWLDDNLDGRVQAICRAIKNKNITLWVVGFGDDLSLTTKANLENCATSGSHYFEAESIAELTANFTAIASQISALRLTQ